MQFEIGSILDGKVTGITKYGAFVELSNGKTGMVHISEVSSSYVENINDYLKENQEVKVKVLDIGQDGAKERIALSIKQAAPKTNSKEKNENFRQNNRRNKENFKFSEKKTEEPVKNPSLDDLLTQFKKDSLDRQSSLKFNEATRKNSCSRQRNSR